MKSYFKMIKRWDIIIIITLSLLSFLPLAIFSYIKASEPASTNSNKQLIAVIKVDKRVTLTGHVGKESFNITQPDGDYNTIEVKDNKIRISAANCNDQVCVRQGTISKQGQTIVCLPHKLVIEIQSADGNSENEDDIIIPS